MSSGTRKEPALKRSPGENFLSPFVRGWAEHTAAISERVRRLRSECSVVQLAWRPRPGAWNMIEVAEHLRLTGEKYYPRLHRFLDSQERRGRTGGDRYSRSPFGRWFLGYLDPESTKKVRAPKFFRPQTSLEDPARIDLFLSQQEELETILRRADGIDLVRGRFASPIPIFRFTLGEGLDMLVTHQERHTRQMEAIPQQPSFPER